MFLEQTVNIWIIIYELLNTPAYNKTYRRILQEVSHRIIALLKTINDYFRYIFISTFWGNSSISNIGENEKEYSRHVPAMERPSILR